MKTKKRSIISLVLLFCILFSVISSTTAIAAEDISKTSVKGIAEKWNWETVFKKDDFQIKGTATSSNTLLLFGENSDGSDSLGVFNDDHTVTLTNVDELLRDLGLENNNGVAEIQSITVIDDTFFISYIIFGTSADTGGFIRTADGKNYEAFDFPYQFTVPDYNDPKDSTLEFKISKYNNTYIVYGRNRYSAIGNYTTYYISTDLKNWTVCQSPSFSVEQYEELNFVVEAITSSGVYFHAYKTEFPTTRFYDLGIFYTNNFKDYINITAGTNPATNYISEHNTALPNGKLAIIQIDDGDGAGTVKGTYSIELYIYDEQTSKMDFVLKSEGIYDDIFWYNTGAFDPIELYTKDLNGQNMAYSISSQNKSVIEKHVLPFDIDEIIYESKWANAVQGENEFSFSAIFTSSNGEVSMLFSDDNWSTAYSTRLNDIGISIENIKTIFTDTDKTDNKIFIVCQNGIIACDFNLLTKHFDPLPTLIDDKTGVSLIPVSKDAIPSNTELYVDLLSDNEKISLFDISIMENETVIQPTYPVYLQIPISSDRTEQTYKVYRYETDGSKTEMIAESAEGYIRFATEHFSKYEIEWLSLDNTTPPSQDIEDTSTSQTNSDSQESESNPPTGDEQKLAIYFSIILLSIFALLCVAIIGKKRRFLNS